MSHSLLIGTPDLFMLFRLMRIITVTANTAVDEVLLVTQVQALKPTFNTTKQLTFPSGKGINVARVVATLGRPVTALGFVGDTEAAQFQRELTSEHVTSSLTPVRGETRINTTICNAARKTVWHIRRGGYSVRPGEYAQFLNTLDRTVRTGDVIVFAGTLPDGIGDKQLVDVIRRCRMRGLRTVVDSSEKDLQRCMFGKPYMIKPNLEELRSLLGLRETPRSKHQLLLATEKIMQHGVKLAVVSRGSRGVFVRSGRRAWTASVSIDGPQSATGAIGSGDALVGGFAIGLCEQQSFTDMIRLGVAAGAANLLCIGPGVLKQSDVARLYQRVALKEISI